MARVLLVDDEADHRQTVADVVRALGHEVIEACGGNEGLLKAGLGGYGLAVIDHAMPDLGGAAIVEAMRVQGDRTPVIVLLNDFKRATLAALMKLGVADMITKPLHIAELEEKIAKVVGRGGDEPAAAPAPVAAPAQAVAQAAAAPRPTPVASAPVMPAARAGSLSSMPAAQPTPTPRAGSLSAVPAAHAVPPTPRPGSLASMPAAPLRAGPASMPAVAAAASTPALAAADEPWEAKVLVVDHMDAACRALAALIPAELGVHTSRNVNEAQLKMRANSYRLIFFSLDLPVNGLPGLIDQLRQVQRDAVFVGVAVAKENGEPPEHKDAIVFDDLVTRPFDEALIADLSDQFSGSFHRLVELSGENVLKVATFRGRRPRLDAYLDQLDKKLQHQLNGLAEACVDQVVIDLLHLPHGHAARAARFVADLIAKNAAMGLELRLVAAPPLQEALRALPESKDVRCFHSVEEAQAA